MRNHLRGILVMLTALVLTGPSTSRAGSLTTTFDSNNGHFGNMFDLVTGANALSVTSLGINLDPGSGPSTIAVYVKSGTWVGSEQTPAAWTLATLVTDVISEGANTATTIFTPGLTLAANGVTAIYITATNPSGSLFYSNGTAVGDVAAQNSDLTILQGAGVAYPFGQSFTPRTWNGTITYATANAIPEPTSIVMAGLAGVVGLAGLSRRTRRPA